MKNKTQRRKDAKTQRLLAFLLMVLFCSSSLIANSQQPTVNSQNPLWMRYNAISPQGDKIAFSYKGDIYVVDAEGGQARQITTNSSYDSNPIWSNDGKFIAFSTDRNANYDVYIVSVDGGVAKRVTTNSTSEIPLAFSADDSMIYYRANIQRDADNVHFPTGWVRELYKVSVDGGRPQQVVATNVCSISFDNDNESFLYYDEKGNEDEWRKHQISSMARDIVYYDAKEKDKELNKLNDTIQLLRTENESLNTSIEQLKVKEQLSDEIINNLNKKASQALKDLEEKDRFYQEKAKDSLTELAELEDLKNQIKEKTDRIVALSAELEEVQSGLQMIDQIQSEMEKFESIKKKKDAKITELQEELQYHKNRVLELESDTESLKNTIENNLYNQAIAEDLLKNEIKQLKATIEEHVGIKNTKKRETKQSQKVRISAIDESLDDADWLISTPPSGTPTRPIPATTENDFGYQAPPKKSTPENEAQMSLW